MRVAAERSTGRPASRRPVLEVRDLAKAYRRGSEEVHALRGVSLRLLPGEVVALVGPSGSGKTTLLNLLCGWERPDGGSVVWMDGASDGGPESRSWQEVAILPQDVGLIEELSIRENVELPLRLSGRRDERHLARADALLRGLGLADLADRMPDEVSTGEQQRTALARCVVIRPRLLLADEPTGHQDGRWARGVLRAIRLSAREGTACLVATHNEETVGASDRLIAIRDGRVHDGPIRPPGPAG